MTTEAILHVIQTEPVIGKYLAGRLFGWGRRATDDAVRQGQLPVIDGPKQPVPTAWTRWRAVPESRQAMESLRPCARRAEDSATSNSQADLAALSIRKGV